MTSIIGPYSRFTTEATSTLSSFLNRASSAPLNARSTPLKLAVPLARSRMRIPKATTSCNRSASLNADVWSENSPGFRMFWTICITFTQPWPRFPPRASTAVSLSFAHVFTVRTASLGFFKNCNTYASYTPIFTFPPFSRYRTRLISSLADSGFFHPTRLPST
eukprot:PhF_6_TR3348/c0_g1_i3/m.4736